MRCLLYKINEVFETIQGEASFTGTPSIFLRLQGCPVGCAWCDTKQTWVRSEAKRVTADEVMQVDGKNGHWSLFTATDLLEKIQQKGWTARWIVITGGEPCMYNLKPLCETFEQAGYQVQVETSGTYPVEVTESTWVTVSPKVNMKGK